MVENSIGLGLRSFVYRFGLINGLWCMHLSLTVVNRFWC